MRQLYTEAGASLKGTPWEDYPRPQMVRKDWLCLNGDWEFSMDGVTATIRVPFCLESPLSGFRGAISYGQEMVYRKRFSIPPQWKGQRILLHFGAVSRAATVLLNGMELCHHENGYLPFTMELTEHLHSGENELTVIAVNDLSHKHPWGKQKKNRGGMWYTPVSGIWQTVWLEPVPEQYICGLKIRTGNDWVEITTEGVDDGIVTLDGQDYPLLHGTVHIPISEPILWSPESPHLYEFSVTSCADAVQSYFALRTLSVAEIDGIPRLCLNGRPYFFHGLLDQGYWSDGLYTPPDPEAFQRDILYIKSLGFNTLRKHIKVEPERFYYDCDRLGVVVFQDMVNCGDYRYIRDTVLPTIGLQTRADKRLHRDPETRANFLSAMEETVSLLQNHPCICLWTIFNEGWGQFDADGAYERLKALDNMRFVNATSGWFHQEKSDVDSLHIYFDKLHLGKERKPQLLSEFGGYSCKIPEHSLKKTYGYRKYTDRAEFVSALRAVYAQEVLPLLPKGLCGAIYTQISDVEDETNGLLTFDRRVLKLLPEEFSDLSEQLCRSENFEAR